MKSPMIRIGYEIKRLKTPSETNTRGRKGKEGLT
jgi:hypothetical protein